MPLRHEAPDGAGIELFVRRVPAADPARRRGEVWLIAGGPGEPGVSLHPMLATFRAAFPDHDLVIPDHRGTGRSTRLCPAQESIDSTDGVALAGAESSHFIKKRLALHRCRRREEMRAIVPLHVLKLEHAERGFVSELGRLKTAGN